MDDRNAYHLAETMHGTWPTTGPTRAAWYDHLKSLEEGPARAAFHAVRKGNARYVLAAFNDEYARITRRVESDQPDVCRTCDGGGWVTTAPLAHNGHEYTQCEPCPHCKLGRAVAGSKVWRDTGCRAHQEPPPLVEGPAISFDQYVARLTVRAGNGDTEAAEMLDVWAQNLARGYKP